MSSLSIEVEHLQQGQPRPYAPHTYESRITVTGARSWNRVDEDRMRALVKLLVHHFLEDDELAAREPMDAHFSPKLMRLERVSDELLSEGEHASLGPHREVWIVRVEIPFTD